MHQAAIHVQRKLDVRVRYSLTQEAHSLYTGSPGKLIHADAPDRTVAGCDEGGQISGKTAGLTGNIEDIFHTIGQDPGQGFGMYPVPRGIQNDGIRLLLDGIKDFKNISCKEGTVGQSVSGGIDLCCLHCLFYDLYADYFPGCSKQ